ncbi:MAG: hypothetical protein AAF761_04120 [Pseudomonadota bacterium]
MPVFLWPTHAYVPGETAPHPAGYFDELFSGVKPGQSADDLITSDAWKMGLGYMDNGYYWEAHRAWSPVVEALPAGGLAARTGFVVLTLAEAGLAARMGDGDVAEALCADVEVLMADVEAPGLGLRLSWISEWLVQVRRTGRE